MQEQETTPTFSEQYPVSVTVNGHLYEQTVPVRMLLSDFLRHELHLTGTHVGCEHGVCGACTVLLNGALVRSCLIFAAQVEGATVGTVESLSPSDANLHPIQEAFQQNHALQCAFCTSGFLLVAKAL